MTTTQPDDKLSHLASLLEKTELEIVQVALDLLWDRTSGAWYCAPTETARAAMIAGSLGFAERICAALGFDVQLEAVGEKVYVTLPEGKSYALEIPKLQSTHGELH